MSAEGRMACELAERAACAHSLCLWPGTRPCVFGKAWTVLQRFPQDAAALRGGAADTVAGWAARGLWALAGWTRAP